MAVTRSGGGIDTTDLEHARDDEGGEVNRPRTRQRRTLLTLLLAPLLCGVLVAGLISAAWLALGSPVPARGRGVDADREDR